MRITKKMKSAIEREFFAKVITYRASDGREHLGGMCARCGAGPSDITAIFRANMCDSDGIYYGMLCGECYEMVEAENYKRLPTERDVKARILGELLGDDIDGIDSMMDE